MGLGLELGLRLRLVERVVAGVFGERGGVGREVVFLSGVAVDVHVVFEGVGVGVLVVFFVVGVLEGLGPDALVSGGKLALIWSAGVGLNLLSEEADGFLLLDWSVHGVDYVLILFYDMGKVFAASEPLSETHRIVQSITFERVI